MFKQIVSLLHKEFLLELRHKSGVSGVLIYSLSSIYICYLAFRNVIEPAVWNALLWIIIFFAATNAIAKSFMSETKGHQLFYYSTLDPRAVILSKSIYNMIFLFLITAINYIAYNLLLGDVVADRFMFAAGMFLGTSALATILTLVSALASRAGNNAALMAILGFPLLVPLLLTIIRFSKNAIEGLGWQVNQPYLIVLLALNVLVLALSYLLFPYLWRD